jgi:hypothetical protein
MCQILMARIEKGVALNLKFTRAQPMVLLDAIEG